MRDKIIALIALGILLVSIMSFALADDANATVTSAVNNSQVDANWTRICANVNERVMEQIQKFDNGKVRRMHAYNNTENEISRLIERLYNAGVDTTQAEADNEILNQQINKFNEDYSSFIMDLESLKNFTCGNSSGQYANQLRIAKEMLPVLRDDAMHIRLQAMAVRGDLVNSRKDLVEGRITKRLNQTDARYENRINQVENRTANVDSRIANRTERVEARIDNFENKANSNSAGEINNTGESD